MKFVKYNANPKNRKTGDCVIRSISTALGDTWEDTYKYLLETTLKYGYSISSTENYRKYLKLKGYQIQKQPKKPNNKRYTIREFIDAFGKIDTTYIISVRGHLTTVINNTLYDTWDCSDKVVGNYYEFKTRNNMNKIKRSDYYDY